MRRMTRTQTAPWIHSVALFGAITALFSWLHIPAIAWLLEHPEAMAGAVVFVSRALGWGVSRMPHLRTSERDYVISMDRVHRRIESVVDSLSYIQAECDTAADHAKAARQIAQNLHGGQT